MNFLADLLSGFRSEHGGGPAKSAGGDREPVGFFARLSAEQQTAMHSYRGDETVGDKDDAAEIKASAKRR